MLGVERKTIQPFGRHRRAQLAQQGGVVDLKDTLSSLFHEFEMFQEAIANGESDRDVSIAPVLSLFNALAKVDASLEQLPLSVRNSVAFTFAREIR